MPGIGSGHFVDLEKKKPSFDRFFHNVLSEFSVVKILASRSICTVLCIYYLSFSMNKILFGKDAAAGEHRVLLGLIGAAAGVITCVLYYSSYKEFDGGFVAHRQDNSLLVNH